MATPVATFISRIPQAQALTKQIALEAVAQVFELDIKPAAVEKSPVTEEGAAINEAMGKKPPHILGTGYNRRSIDVTTEESEKGPLAKLFTQSGYGGYLETGTSKMRAQPYLYPAFIENVDKVPATIQVKIGEQGKLKP
jgi:HK97 gp10 family phage protein